MSPPTSAGPFARVVPSPACSAGSSRHTPTSDPGALFRGYLDRAFGVFLPNVQTKTAAPEMVAGFVYYDLFHVADIVEAYPEMA